METKTAKKARAKLLLDRLGDAYPDALCGLEFRNPFEILIATILSAQCTDARVNQVTPALFERFPNPQAFADADVLEVERLIRPTGFFHNKAKNIVACSKALIERHGGEVPSTMEELVHLAGVGRKTANVVLCEGFAIPGVTVDTHVGRLSRRMALTKHADPVKVEFDIRAIHRPENWNLFNHRMIAHGRKVCHSRGPKCEVCPVADLCPKVGVTATRKGSAKSAE